MSLLHVIFGRPLASSEDAKQRIGSVAGVSVFGLDALSSAAYGPEAALTVLIPLGLQSPNTSSPVICAIAGLLLIVYFSYRQTIAAYPKGAGSYTVARENLGTNASLLAAVALLVDYVLNVAVGISSGVGQLISAIPSLQPFTLPICLVILAILAFLNLRGVREAGFAFMPPSYLFVFCLSLVLIGGFTKTLWSHGHPQPVATPPHLPDTHGSIDLWLILRSFASGCTALTGVEAVSNGIQVFREPVVAVARRTLTVIIAILMLLLLGVAYLVPAYHIGATESGKSGYESILSQLTGAVFGRGVFYYLTIISILLVVVVVAPLFWAFMIFVNRHYRRIEKETAISEPTSVELAASPIAVVPVEQWDSVSQKALQLAYAFSKEVHILHVHNEVEENDFKRRWKEAIEPPIVERGLRPPELVFLRSPYRKVITPILNYVESISNEGSGHPVAVLVPELIESHWYYSFLHNQRAAILKALLLRRGNLRVVVVSVPWRLEKGTRDSDRNAKGAFPDWIDS